MVEGLIEMVASQVTPEMTGASTGWEERALQAKGTVPQGTGLVCWRNRSSGYWESGAAGRVLMLFEV